MKKENKITTIKKYKKKIALYIDDKRFDFDINVLGMFYLYEGKILSTKEKKELIETNESISLYKYAISLLKKYSYTEWKMREKLYQKTNNKHLVDLVIDKLKKANLINDKELVNELLIYYNEQNIGKNKIILKLKEKGVFDIELTELSFPIDSEKKKAKNILPLLSKKYDKYNYEQKKRHIYNALLLKGFDAFIASSLLNEVHSNKKEDELLKLQKDFKTARLRLEKKYDGELLKKMIFVHLKEKGYHYNDIMSLWEDVDI